MDKESFFHDHGYKYLFQNPTMVRYLITSFVKEDWVKEIDFTKMEKLDKEFIEEEYQGRESDVIYKIGYRGSEAYLFLLIEFQSRVDRFMALRTLNYICKFYLDLLELNKDKKYKFLPPVFPVVLYNGNRKWTAPLEFRDLIEHGGKGLEAYLPDFRYYKIAENEFPKEILRKLNNLIAALFYIETSSAEEIKEAIGEIIEILMNEEDKMAVSRFLTWFKNLAERKGLKDDEGKDYHIYNPWEVKNMLTATLDKIRLQGREEGKKEGKEEGKKEGRKLGKKEGRKELVEVINLYLISHFNQTPAELVKKMKKIEDLGELKRLASQIYKCRNLEEIKSL